MTQSTLLSRSGSMSSTIKIKASYKKTSTPSGAVQLWKAKHTGHGQHHGYKMFVGYFFVMLLSFVPSFRRSQPWDQIWLGVNSCIVGWCLWSDVTSSYQRCLALPQPGALQQTPPNRGETKIVAWPKNKLKRRQLGDNTSEGGSAVSKTKLAENVD